MSIIFLPVVSDHDTFIFLPFFGCAYGLLTLALIGFVSRISYCVSRWGIGFDWVCISYLVLRIAYRAGGLGLIGFELGLFFWTAKSSFFL